MCYLFSRWVQEKRQLPCSQAKGNWAFIHFLHETYPQKGGNCINVQIGISSQKIFDRFKGALFSDKLGPQESHLNDRLGYLMGMKEDYWWALSSTSEEKVAETLTRGIREFGIPFIEKHISDEDLCRFFLSTMFKHWFGRLLIFIGLGDRRPLLYLVFLLKETGDEVNFKKVAKFIYKRHRQRPFLGGGSIGDFLLSLGFHP